MMVGKQIIEEEYQIARRCKTCKQILFVYRYAINPSEEFECSLCKLKNEGY